MTPKRGFLSPRELLPGLLGKLSGESGRATGLVPIWEDVVGSAIARSAVPEVMQAGVLTVRVVDAHWKSELEPRAPELLTRLQERLGADRIVGLRFEVQR